MSPQHVTGHDRVGTVPQRPAPPRHPAEPGGSEPVPGRAVVGWSVRQLRRSTAILAVAAAGYMAAEVASYSSTYPDGVSAEQFALFVDSPAGRMLQGVPHGLDSAAGFAVWDGGWVLQTVVGIWALLVTCRLLRGEEDAGRVELLLVGPIRSDRVVALTSLVVVAGTLLVAVCGAGALVASGAQVAPAALFGLGLAGFGATFAGLGAVASQVVDARRRASGLTAGALGLSFLVRMAANSTDDRAWLGWLTPFGWVDRLQPFGEPAPVALVPLLVTPVALLVAAVALRVRRDAGGAFLVSTDSHRPRLRGLAGATSFAWRSNQAVLLGWMLGLAAYAFMVGSLVSVMTDFLDRDDDYRRLLAELDLGAVLTVDGFLGVMSVTLAVGFALYAAWRIGAVRVEEASGRAANLLARRVTRVRWLAGHVLLTVVGSGLLTVSTGLALWAGALASGTGEVTADGSLRAVLNTGSVVVLVTGLAVLTLGVAPRLTVAVPVGVSVGGYVLALLGPALSWPGWVTDLSPFAHLAYVPAEPFDAGSALVMVLIGVAAAVVGVGAFTRRDTVGA